LKTVVTKAPFRLNLLDVLPFIGDTSNKGCHGMSTLGPVIPGLGILVAGEYKQFGYKLHVPTLCIYIQRCGVSPLEKFRETATPSMPFVENDCLVFPWVVTIEPSPS